jgi:hypothetical protein
MTLPSLEHVMTLCGDSCGHTLKSKQVVSVVEMAKYLTHHASHYVRVAWNGRQRHKRAMQI